MRTVDIAIIGGGAAGMTAAITAAVRAPEKRILIIEKNDRLGRKLRATGNGRCNLTNTACPGYEETIAFFREIGVQTRVEQEGRVYPLSGDAADVVEALAARVKRLGIEVICGTACEKVTKTEKKTESKSSTSSTSTSSTKLPKTGDPSAAGFATLFLSGLGSAMVTTGYKIRKRRNKR